MNAKERFVGKGDVAKRWSDLTATEDFAEATGAAMLLMVEGLPQAKDTNAAAINSIRLDGAKEFLRHLLMLGEPSRPMVERKDTDNLIHT